MLNNNLHYFSMFGKSYAFDCISKFVFSIDELSTKIVNHNIEQADWFKYDNDLIKKELILLSY